MVKKTRRPIENSGNHSNKTRITAALLVFVLLGSGVALVFSNSDSNQDGDNEFSSNILPTNCPKNDKSSPRTIDFTRPPPRCIEPQKTHTAVFDTTEGEIRVALDTSLIFAPVASHKAEIELIELIRWAKKALAVSFANSLLQMFV